MKVKNWLLVLVAVLLTVGMTVGMTACNPTPEAPKEPQIPGPLQAESDDALLARFLGEYEKALSAPAYFKEYRQSTRLDGELVNNAIGYFMVNGDDFLVQWEESPQGIGAVQTVILTYLDGTLYTQRDGAVEQVETDLTSALSQLESVGLVYRQAALSDISDKTLTRNPDGTFAVNLTLTEAALQQISQKALSASAVAGLDPKLNGVAVTLTFSMEGTLLKSVFTTDVSVTSDGQTRTCTTEGYLKYTSFDASTITVKAPEVK